jgi:hypothetical protein
VTYLEKWKINIITIDNVIKNNPSRKLPELAAIMAVATGIPVIDCSYILEEKFGENPELTKNIEALKKFYKKV